MDEAKVKAFLNIKAGTTEDSTFEAFKAEHGGDLTASVADYLDAAVDAGSMNGSPDYMAWCKTAAADIIGGKYASIFWLYDGAVFFALQGSCASF